MLKKAILILFVLFIVSGVMTKIDSGTLNETETIEKDSKTSEFINVQNTEKKDELSIQTKEFYDDEKEITNITEEKPFIIAIDAGHQLIGNNEKEPIGPGALESKPKVSSGTKGILSNKPEYELTLEISLKLKEALIDEGYEVLMIREQNDVNISNAERAKIANDSADIFIRIHANGSEDSFVRGITTLCPSSENEYCSEIYEDSYALSKCILENLVESTSDNDLGISEVDNMTGINYCTIPVSIVEVGFLTNPETDELLNTDDYQDKVVSVIVDGINNYYSKK